MASLERRAAQAPARSRCYIYAQLVYETVEFTAREYAAGNPENAAGMLKRSQEFANRIRAHLTGDSKRLKETQILLRRSAYRLTDLLHSTEGEDVPLVEETLAQLNRIQNDVMMRVFSR